MAHPSQTPQGHLRERWTREHFPESVGADYRLSSENPAERGPGGIDDEEDSEEAIEDDMELSEVAVPLPSHRDDPRRPSWEDAVRFSSRDSHERGDRQGDMNLTELTIPAPAQPENPRTPSLEGVMRRLSSHKSRDRNEQLGEVAGLEPVGGGEKPSDEETPVDSSNQNSLEEQQDKMSATLESPAVKPSPIMSEVITVGWLIFFSLLGTLARLGVEAITLYPNSPFPSRVLWANLGGSLFMAFLAEDRRLFRQPETPPDLQAADAMHKKVKKTIPLYIGLATGFCGSFTSFSSYVRDCFLALTNALEPPSPTSPYHVDSNIASRNGGFSFLALLAIMIVHPAVSIAALQVGAQLALFLQPVTPTIPVKFARMVLNPLSVVLGFGCWLGAVFLAIWPPGNDIHWRFRAVQPLVFAPVGCLMRFYVSKHMNALVPSFPLGTFTVNMLGTAVLGMAFDLQHARHVGASSANACAVLQGVMEGFCGCVTTVSTWVAEIHGLRRRHGWIYGLTSVGAGLAMMVVIMGSMGWTVGFTPPACS
ncbi:Fluoride export protein 1 [Exophiala dermatitidis]